MNDVRTRPGLLVRGWRRLLDGDRMWGSIDVRSDRFGVTRYRLVVYPPGIDTSERRRVRAARGWPMWGLVMWVACEIWASQLTGPWTALAISTGTALLAGHIAVWLAGEARTRVRTLVAAGMVGQHDPVSAAAVERLKVSAGHLIEADDSIRDGRLSPADHEAIWWKVYDDIESDRTAHPSRAA
jgi:hypothetical protein